MQGRSIFGRRPDEGQGFVGFGRVAWEHFADYGVWDRPAVERWTISLIERKCPARWGGYHPVAVDDSKLHRTSGKVFGHMHVPRVSRS